MNFSKLSEKKTGAVISYITLLAQSLTTILLTPFFIHTLGQAEYGLFELVGSTVSYLSILGLGFSSSYIRFYSRYETKKENDKIAALNGMFMTLFMLMSLSCIIIGVILTLNVNIVFGSAINENTIQKSKLIMIILVFEMALRFPLSMFVANTGAHEKFIFQKSLMLIETLLVPVLRIIFVIGGFTSIGLALASLCVTLFETVVNIVYNLRKLDIKFAFGRFDRKLFREISVYTFFIFINQIYDLLGGSKVDVYIIGRCIGTEEVTVYSVADKFVKIFYSISSPLGTVFVPQINRIIAENKMNVNEIITDIFTRVSKLQLILQYLTLSGFILFGKQFIALWMGKGYEKAYLIAAIIMSADLVALSQHVGIEIQRAKNKHKVRSVVLLLTNIGNILLTIPLTIRIGSVGAAVATAMCEVVGTIFFMNWYYERRLFIKIMPYWLNMIKIISVSLIPIGVIFLLDFVIPSSGMILLFVRIILFTMIYGVVVWLFILNESEKKQIIKR